MHRAEVIVADVDVVSPTGERILHGIDWTIRQGDAWALLGPSGAGKTTLTEVIAGQRRVSNGQVIGPHAPVARVAFREQSKAFSYSKHYYQQRFNFIEAEDDLTLEQFLRSAPIEDESRFVDLTRRLGLAPLLSRSFIKMSNGQTRRARIVKALLQKPSLLILDEPFVGLDRDGRAEVDALLRQLHADGLPLIVVIAPEETPSWVTHVLELRNGSVGYQGPRDRFHLAARTQVTGMNSPARPTSAETIIELRDVNVAYGETSILRHIDWQVRAGERWAILGPNGSGKTTLLSLIVGDHPQAYRNEVKVFGQQRGSGESIWELKRRIGQVSPELHLYFSAPLRAEQVAATGFFDVLVARRTTLEQDERVKELFEYFRINDLGPRPFASLSTSQQRIVLLIRALVKDPPLLVLDEPFQTLDRDTIDRARGWIDGKIDADRTVLFVTHNEAELPRTITRRLRLQEGKIVECV